METDNKEKLTLKELAGHLPWETKVLRVYNNEILLLHGISGKNTIEATKTVLGIEYSALLAFGDTNISDDEEFKLLLRPTSDLTKPITHNGETFVPIVEILKELSLYNLSGCIFEYGYDGEGSDNDFWGNAYNNDGYQKLIDSITFDGNIFKAMNNDESYSSINPQHETLELLNKYHFDWKYNLIERGLAVNLNTISNE